VTTRIYNEITIGGDTSAFFNYVTQPWRWHEWHPNSQQAHATVDVLAPGDGFDEVIRIYPLSPLPIAVKRQTRYSVLAVEKDRLWEVEGQMSSGWLRIRY